MDQGQALTVGGREYHQEVVDLHVTIREENGMPLEFSLCVNNGQPNPLGDAGITINCIRLDDVMSMDGLSGYRLRLPGDRGRNEVGESVAWSEGVQLEFASLDIDFGVYDGGSIPIEVQAECVNPKRGLFIRAIPVTAHLLADVKIRRPYGRPAHIDLRALASGDQAPGQDNDVSPHMLVICLETRTPRKPPCNSLHAGRVGHRAQVCTRSRSERQTCAPVPTARTADR